MILVTGAAGFIGTRVVHELRARERDVRALVHSPARAGPLANWDVELGHGDVTDPESLRTAAEGCDEIVHLVSILTGSKADFERVMAQGTRNLVEAAAPKRRLVLMSALGVDDPRADGISLLRGEARDGARRPRVGVRVRDPEAELRVRRRRGARHVPPARAPLARDADRR